MLFTILFIAAIIVAMIAHSKGKNWFLWFLYGLLIWPIALVHILLSKPTTAESSNYRDNPDGPRRCPSCKKIVHGVGDICPYCKAPMETRPTSEPVSADRECPFCAELIKKKAVKCKHCGSDVDPIPEARPPEPKQPTPEPLGNDALDARAEMLSRAGYKLED